MTGAGNDFILIDNRDGQYDHIKWAELAPKLCNRYFGVGGDGLLVLNSSHSVDFKLDYYNSDGSYGGMCGNGGRCASHYYMDMENFETSKFESLDYIYHASRINKSDILLKMKPVSFINIKDFINLFNLSIPIYFINTGAPHVVIFIDDLSEDIKKKINVYGINEIGRIIRYHEKFQPDGTNVDFLEIDDKGKVVMRTYERGVETETLACGTGAVACATVAHIIKKIPVPVEILTYSKNILRVSFKFNGSSFEEVELKGPALKVFEGIYKYK